MKILVPLKKVPDANQKIKLQSGHLDFSTTTWQINQFDEYALEAALRLTENATNPTSRLGEVVVVSIGPADVQPHLRTALAMGADRALWVRMDDQEPDAAMVAALLAKLVQQEKPDWVLMGKLAADGEGHEVGQRLAGLLGYPQATCASSLVLQDNTTMLVGREIDQGIEFKKIKQPAVVTVDLRIIAKQAVQNGVTPPSFVYPEGARFASLKGITTAKKKPLEERTPEQLQVSFSPWVQTIHYEIPPPRQAGVRVQSAKELLNKLHQQAKVL